MRGSRYLLDFDGINRIALINAEEIVTRWLPDGHKEGTEWVARNPRRYDRSYGSFKINLLNGKWADFATGDAGGDLVSLAAYLADISQGDAAREVAKMMGVATGD